MDWVSYGWGVLSGVAFALALLAAARVGPRRKTPVAADREAFKPNARPEPGRQPDGWRYGDGGATNPVPQRRTQWDDPPAAKPGAAGGS